MISAGGTRARRAEGERCRAGAQAGREEGEPEPLRALSMLLLLLLPPGASSAPPAGSAGHEAWGHFPSAWRCWALATAARPGGTFPLSLEAAQPQRGRSASAGPRLRGDSALPSGEPPHPEDATATKLQEKQEFCLDTNTRGSRGPSHTPHYAGTARGAA